MKKFLPSCLKYTFAFILILSLVITESNSQAPPVEWEKSYVPEFQSMPMTARGYSVHQLPDGGYVAAGNGTSPMVKAYIVRTDSNGDTLWTVSHFQDNSEHSFANCRDILPVSDGGFIVYGHGIIDVDMNRGVHLLKLNPDGSLEWNKEIPLADYSFLTTGELKESNDGGYIMTGTAQKPAAFDIFDVFILKTDAQGNTVWLKFFGDAEDGEKGYSVECAHGGGYVVTGEIEDEENPSGATLFMKFKENGDLDWSKKYTDEPPNEYNCIRKTSDGGYALAGTDGGQYVLMKTDTELEVQWKKKYGRDEDAEHAYSFDLTNDGGYILSGWGQEPGHHISKLWVVRTDEAGNMRWDFRLGGDVNSSGECIRQTSDGGYILAGYNENQGGTDNLYLLKLGADIDGVLENATKRGFEVSPNPVRSRATVLFTLEKAAKASLTLFDMQGRPLAELFDGIANEGRNEIAFDADYYTAGMYYCFLNISGEKALLLINIVK